MPSGDVGSISVLTQHNDNARTGANLQETILNTSNVNPRQFGKLFEVPVDGHIYAQPLYINNLAFPDSSIHNVVYVATMHDTVYALDADDGTVLWKSSLGPAISLPDPNIGGGNGYHDIAVEVGILSTPVISLQNNAIYVVGATKEGNQYFHRLHALALDTGNELFNGPVALQGSVKGAGVGSVNGTINFQSHLQNQRPGLLLSHGKIYIGFASYGDNGPYHGWIFGYDAITLQSTAVFCSTPNSQVVNGHVVPDSEGGIWQAGQGLAGDSDGLVYAITGNGSFRPDWSAYGDCILKFRDNLTVLDWFAPFNNAALNQVDEDLGSSGVMLIPDTDLVIGGGKESIFYVMHKNQMGHFNPQNNNQILQTIQIHAPDANTHHIHGGPAYWNGPKGPWIYIWVEGDVPKAYQFTNGKFQTNPVSQHTNLPQADSIGMPGGAISLSANGNTSGTGILWTSHPHNQERVDGKLMDANQHIVRGILRAFDATDLSRELWNSQMQNDDVDASTDSIGNFAKFCAPTVANGKVYLASFGRDPVGTSPTVAGMKRETFHLAVYGLNS